MNLKKLLAVILALTMITGSVAFAAPSAVTVGDSVVEYEADASEMVLANEATVITFEELKEALADGGDITVAADIIVDEALTIPEGVTVTVAAEKTLRVLDTLTNNGTIKGDGKVSVDVMVYVVKTVTPYEDVSYNVTATKNGALAGTAPECAVTYDISLDGGDNWFTDTTGGKAQAVTVKTDGTTVVSASFQSAFTSAKTGETVHMLKDAHVQSTNTKKNNGPLRSYYGLILEGNSHTIFTDLEPSGASNEYATIKFTSYLAGTGPEVNPVLKNVTIDSQKNAKADLDFVSGDVTFTVTMYNVNLLGNCQYASFAMKSPSMTINKSEVEIFDCEIPSWDAGSAKAIDFYSGKYTLSFNSKCTVYGGTYTKDPTNYLADGLMIVKNDDGDYGVKLDPAYGKVARIGDDYYETITEAIDEAEAGDVIELIANATIDNTTNINKSITINGNGKEISQSLVFAANASNAMLDILGGATVTFNNVTFDGIKNVAIMRTVNASVVIDNCVVSGCTQTVEQGLLRLACGNATITNSKFVNNDCHMVISFGYDAANETDVLTMDGCLFEGNTCTGPAVVYFANGDKGTVTNTKFIDNTVTTAGNAATLYMGWGAGFEVSGCLFDKNEVITSHATTKRFASAIFADGCKIENNVFLDNSATRNGEAIATTVAVAAYYGEAEVSSNYWNGGAPSYTVEYDRNEVKALDYYTSYDAETGALSDKKELVAKVGKVNYATLEDAFMAAVDGDTITLLRDIALDKTLINKKKITLDLGGKTITGTDNATGSFGLIEIQPSAELTIIDTSAEKSGKITLTATNDRDWNAYSSVISNQRGKLTVNGGTLEHLGGTDMAYGIDNLTNGKDTYAETIINGGLIKSTYRGIRQFLNGVDAQNILTVNGGTVEGANKSIWMQDPSKNANTGTLTVGEEASLVGDVYLFVTAGSTEWPVEVSIAAAALEEGSTVMTGNVPEKYVVKESNGAYGVHTAPVATLGGVEYTKLADAINAVTAENNTITLIKDTNEVEEFVIDGKTVVIDLNENTLFGAILENTNGDITIKNGSIVNKNRSYSGIEINSGKLTLENVNIDSARHSVRVDGKVIGASLLDDSALVTVVIDGGKYTLNSIEGTSHAVNVSGSSDVTIKNGTFIGPRGTTMDSGSAVNVQTGSKVTIKGGNFSMGKNHTLNSKGTLIVEGGTYDQDVSEWCSLGYVCEDNKDGTYSVVSIQPDAFKVTATATASQVRYNNGEPDTFTVEYVVTGGNVVGAIAELKFDPELFECTTEKYKNNTTGIIRFNSYNLTTDSEGETLILALDFKVKKNPEQDKTYTFIAGKVEVSSDKMSSGLGIQEGPVENLIGVDVTVVAQYDVTLPADGTLAGNKFVDKNKDYTAEIVDFDEDMTYTISYTMGNDEKEAIITKNDVVDGNKFVIENVSGDIVFTSVEAKLNCEIVLVQDFVTNHTLVLVKNGVSAGYTYDGQAMFRVCRYEGLEDTSGAAYPDTISADITKADTVRAILVSGSVDDENVVRAKLEATSVASKEIKKSYDVNGTGGDISFSGDAMTAYFCYGKAYDFTEQTMLWYLSSDVNTDFVVDTDDYNVLVDAYWAQFDDEE